MNKIEVELQEWMGSDRSIAEAAWTSSIDFQKKQQRNEEDVSRIVNMLADFKHSVPFESVIFRFWIKLPIQTDRQHMTHRIASHSGMSGRYRTMPDQWMDVPKDIEEILARTYMHEETHKEIKRIIGDYNQICEEANTVYRDMIDEFKEAERQDLISNKDYKRLREFFRGMLPQNNMTERVTVINLRSWANYQKLRNSEHAQPEIREIAQQMFEKVKEKNICPIALAALERNGWII